MKKIIKQFALGEWLLVLQFVFSAIALVLAITTDNFIADAFGLAWGIFSSFILLVILINKNMRNYKSHDVISQFIFNKLGDSYSDFMDYLMSDEYKPDACEEHSLLQERLVEIAKNGDYNSRRKMSRALPNLYEIDRKMAVTIAEVLRDDIFDSITDIRRRTIESSLQIIQKTVGVKKQRKVFARFAPLFAYCDSDDSYTIVASIESYFYAYTFIAQSEKERKAILAGFTRLKEDVRDAMAAQKGMIDREFDHNMDVIWDTLAALYRIGHGAGEEVALAKEYVEGVLTAEDKFPKLTVVKYLFYTCSGYPACLVEKKCMAKNSDYMLSKIDGFLANAIEDDPYLAMPTVRYFDCVCNNYAEQRSRKGATSILLKYFTHPELIITQTAFDKFAKLQAVAPRFAAEVLSELLDKNAACLEAESIVLTEKIAALPEEKKKYYVVTPGRKKFKIVNAATLPRMMLGSDDPEIGAIDGLINEHDSRLRFVAKLKKTKESL